MDPLVPETTGGGHGVEMFSIQLTAVERVGDGSETVRQVEAARPVPEVNELLLAELAATRYMLLNLFHASAKAAGENQPFLPEAVLKIREAADARKHGTAKKMLQEFRATPTASATKPGGAR